MINRSFDLWFFFKFIIFAQNLNIIYEVWIKKSFFFKDIVIIFFKIFLV